MGRKGEVDITEGLPSKQALVIDSKYVFDGATDGNLGKCCLLVDAAVNASFQSDIMERSAEKTHLLVGAAQPRPDAPASSAFSALKLPHVAVCSRRGRDRAIPFSLPRLGSGTAEISLPGAGHAARAGLFFFFSLPDWETAGHVTVFPATGRAAGSPSRDFPDREIHASPPFTSRPSTASRPGGRGQGGGTCKDRGKKGQGRSKSKQVYLRLRGQGGGMRKTAMRWQEKAEGRVLNIS
ncbi:hypothetical protein NDU88_008630 [Pleurodeles waltl]|uniref:Uncharacterized protein n=1 Tax=Pleurodeles waltl TaxID=8319 RepID=A0AAV7PQ13_PLEWA|nr:hypothetical protein NDU88_008630 [Pleurodeles waltl]